MLGAILAVSVAVSGASQSTDFGVRIVGAPAGKTVWAPGSPTRGGPASTGLAHRGGFSLASAAALGRQWGRVTSTYRSPEHNRRVGGVRNSFHIAGRAIDIGRRPGVSHSAIEAAFRRAGFWLVESLDEGDHSHFAFGFGPGTRTSLTPRTASAGEVTRWKVIYAPR